MWTMRCLLCQSGNGGQWVDLVSLQEHVMYEHGYSRTDLRWNTRRPLSRTKDHFVWTMPDGRDWMEAKKANGQ